jgi:hypothetical protein
VRVAFSTSQDESHAVALHSPPIAQRKTLSTATMSDAGSDAAKGLSDDELGGPVAQAESDNGGTPRDTVEENGLEDDEDDLFGDGGDAEEEPAV